MTSNLEVDIKAYLEANLSLASDGPLTYSNPFVVAVPQLSDRNINMIALANILNDPPVMELKGYIPLAYTPRLQVKVRSEKYQDGKSICNQIIKLFELKQHKFVGTSGTCYGGMSALQLPTWLGYDRMNDYLWSWNYQVYEYPNI